MKKKITKAYLRNFAESLASSLEEVADKIGTIEAIINGDEGAETETVDEDEDYVEEPSEEEDESETDAEPVENGEGEGEGEATADENFSDATAHYENVKNFLTL